MKTSFLLFSAAGLLAFGNPTHAANRDVNEYLQRASATATDQVLAAGVEAAAHLVVKARVASDGGLINVHVIGSSGSLETDRQATRALRHLKVSAPPLALIGAEVSVAVGPQPVVQAKTP